MILDCFKNVFKKRGNPNITAGVRRTIESDFDALRAADEWRKFWWDVDPDELLQRYLSTPADRQHEIIYAQFAAACRGIQSKDDLRAVAGHILRYTSSVPPALRAEAVAAGRARLVGYVDIDEYRDAKYTRWPLAVREMLIEAELMLCGREAARVADLSRRAAAEQERLKTLALAPGASFKVPNLGGDNHD